uniref:CARD domain-containing protein n=1 Tax=Myripristis murdjan TaxID=586833 RepID=A0A667X6G7_9TELE
MFVSDVTEEYERVKTCYHKLPGNPVTKVPMKCVKTPKPKAPSHKSKTHAQSHVPCVRALIPDIFHATNDRRPRYRLDCCGAGLFQCSLTGLVFEMEKKGEVSYRTVDWDSSLPTLMPAGPLFRIECPQRCVQQLYLPHCEEFCDAQKLSVAHEINGEMEDVHPSYVDATYVRVEVTNLSLYGLFRKCFSHLQVQSQVVLFQQQAGNCPQTCTLNVFLLPRNLPTFEVESYYPGCTLIQTTSNCILSPKGRYGLVCESVAKAEIQPKSGTFDCGYGPNYQPTFQVCLEAGVKAIKLILMDRGNNDKAVWETQVTLAAGQQHRQLCSETSSSSAPTERKDTASEFVMKHRDALIQQVSMVLHIADDLLVDEIITDEMYSRVSDERSRQEKMRQLLDTVCAGGETAISAFCKALRKYQPDLFANLERPTGAKASQMSHK